MSIAWVFPGQGSQKVGMASSLISLKDAQKKFEIASEILQKDLLAICNEDNGTNQINLTVNTQPALFVVEAILSDELKKQGRKANFVAGHSLGEISALYAAEVFDFMTAIKLLKIRSELMSKADVGSMAAIIGFDHTELMTILQTCNDVFLANDNSSSQVVISGSPKGIDNFISLIKCKKAIPLKVSGAFHSPFMKKASDEFTKVIAEISFKKAKIPVISNSDPSISSDPEQLKNRLINQMINGVRWRETMDIMTQNGLRTFVEIGPGNVLSGLAKRSLKDVVINQINCIEDLGY